MVASLPSTLDPYGFTRLVLSGIWLQVTGLLMVRSLRFPRLLGYLGFFSGFGTMVLFLATIAERPPRSMLTTVIMDILAVPGAICAPLFWLGTAFSLWKPERE
jgi:hypothetical protein